MQEPDAERKSVRVLEDGLGAGLSGFGFAASLEVGRDHHQSESLLGSRRQRVFQLYHIPVSYRL